MERRARIKLIFEMNTQETFPLRTARGLELRPVEPGDGRILFQLTAANRGNLRLWLPWVDGIQGPADTARFIEISRRSFAEGTGLVLAVRLQGRVIGVVDFHHLDSINRKASIGYWLGERWRGNGLMSEAVACLVKYGFQALGLNRIEIRVAPENERSRRIPERLGFREEGHLRQAEWLYDHFVDHVVYGLVRTDWLSRESPAE